MRAVIGTGISCAEQSQVVKSSGLYFMRPQQGCNCVAISFYSCFVTRSCWGSSCRFSVSLCWYFLRLPTAADMGSYPLLGQLLSWEAPAWSSRTLLYLLVFIYYQCVDVQLSPITAVIVTRISCSKLTRNSCSCWDDLELLVSYYMWEKNKKWIHKSMLRTNKRPFKIKVWLKDKTFFFKIP